MQINPVNNICSVQTVHSNSAKCSSSDLLCNLPVQQVMKMTEIPFNGFFSDLIGKKFSTQKENDMYKDINASLSGKDKTNFEILYKTGRLTNRSSNDKSSTLENLYKIYKMPRIKGLSNNKILSETIERLANPFIINQKFGQIPSDVASRIISEKTNTSIAKATNPYEPKTAEDMNVGTSACCVAASIEFSLADKKPAEFARFVAGLTGEEMAINQKIEFSNLNSNLLDAIYLLKLFNIKPKDADWNSSVIRIAPDRDAIIRARVQSTQYDGKNRSSVDVLLQSAFMQLGSQSTYNSLTDKRYGSLSADNSGLTEMEKTFVESVVNNDGEKTSVVYQNLDENGVVKGYFYKHEETQKHILDTLAQGKSVIIGITPLDENNKIIGGQGHEITVIGSKIENGELYFICNDTDDNYVGQVDVKARTLIPQIHHAGIPVNVLPAYNTENQGLKLLREYAAKYASNTLAR